MGDGYGDPFDYINLNGEPEGKQRRVQIRRELKDCPAQECDFVLCSDPGIYSLTAFECKHLFCKDHAVQKLKNSLEHLNYLKCGGQHRIPDCQTTIPFRVFEQYARERLIETRWLEVYTALQVQSACPDGFVECSHCRGRFAIEDRRQRIQRCPVNGCGARLCIVCGVDHKGMSCEERKTGTDAFTTKMLQRFPKCPGCGVPVSKVAACNHMTHKRCPGRGTTDVHFCNTCGVELRGPSGRRTLDGRIHFPNGVFSPCSVALSRIRNRRPTAQREARSPRGRRQPNNQHRPAGDQGVADWRCCVGC